MIGSGAIVRARLRGATVIAVDIDHSKLEIAGKLGAGHAINPVTQNCTRSWIERPGVTALRW
jgi:Zn-dependent alcohol dehydrogenase